MYDSSNIPEHLVKMVRNWSTFNKAVKGFVNTSNLLTFQKLYDDDNEGYRLYNHFLVDCNRDYLKFETYLTSEQKQTTLIYILKNHLP
jgi:hypothetical protein